MRVGRVGRVDEGKCLTAPEKRSEVRDWKGSGAGGER